MRKVIQVHLTNDKVVELQHVQYIGEDPEWIFFHNGDEGEDIYSFVKENVAYTLTRHVEMEG